VDVIADFLQLEDYSEWRGKEPVLLARVIDFIMENAQKMALYYM
jgi:hypothetical protein